MRHHHHHRKWRNWGQHRGEHGTINLVAMLEHDIPHNERTASFEAGVEYLRTVCEMHPIRSRQAAAIALATGLHIAMGHL